MAKKIVFVPAVFVLVLVCWFVRQSWAKTGANAAHSSSPVIVELFTSEGCSSCPPADKLLEQLDNEKNIDGIPVVVLSEHVDYWDGLGWKDRFSSRAFTDRQAGYARSLRIDSPYTPQMVVDGRFELIGSDAPALRRSVHRASDSVRPANVSLSWTTPTQLQVAVSTDARTNADVLLAITESGLTTKVDAGENGGRILRHAGVVRFLRDLGTTKDGRFSLSVPVSIDAAWNKNKLSVIAIVQDGPNGPVLGAAAQPVR